VANAGEPEPSPSAEDALPQESGADAGPPAGDPTQSAIHRWLTKTGKHARIPASEPAPAAPPSAPAPANDPPPAPQPKPKRPVPTPTRLKPAKRKLKGTQPAIAPRPAIAAAPPEPAQTAAATAPAPSKVPSAPDASPQIPAASKPLPSRRRAPVAKPKTKTKAKAKPSKASLKAPAKRGRPAFASLGRSVKEQGLVASPAWAIATLLHALLLLVLSLFTVARYIKEAPKEVEVALRAQTRIEEQALPEPRETVASLIDAPPLPAELDVDRPHEEALGDITGPSTQDTSVLFGLEGSSGKAKGRGGDVTQGAQGPSAASEGARDAGLEWLARHRSNDGGWGAFERYHTPDAPRSAAADVGRTGLAVLAFLAAGHSPASEGPYQDLLVRARDWLVRRCRPNGVFLSPGHAHHLYYQQAIGTLALAELVNLEPQREELSEALQRSVDFLESRRGRWGWRYPDSVPEWSGDTSVNTWVTLALKSAAAADAEVSSKNFRVVKRFLDRVSSGDGTTGYATRGQHTTDAMNASGLFLRIMLGESPSSRRNAAAVRLVRYAGGPREVEGGVYNLYGIYYASLALYQVGGDDWEAYNPSVRDGLVALQVRRRGCELGAWLPGGYLGQDWVLGTAFATLTLETYYRYLPTHDGVNEPDPEPEEAAPRISPGEAALAAATEALLAAKDERKKGDLLAVEAKLAQAAETLRQDTSLDDTQRAALLTLCRERLVAVATLAKDGPLALERAEAYLAALPEGMPPSGAVLSVRVEEGFAQLVQRTVALLKLKPPESEAVHAQLEAIQAFLNEEPTPELPPSTAQRLPTFHDALRAQRAELVFRLPPLEARDFAERWVRGTDPQAERAPDPLELRWVRSLIKQADRGYRTASESDDEKAFARAESARATLGTRRLRKRGSPATRARFDRDLKGLEVVRVHALLRLGRLADAASAARKLGEGGSPVEGALDLECKALAELRQAGELTQAQAQRYRTLLEAWAAQGTSSSAERLVLAGELGAVGAGELAQKLYRGLRDDPDEAIRERALVSLAGLAREAGNYTEARGWLQACKPRVAVRLELARLARDEGRKHRALEVYVELLQGLEDVGQLERWWEVAEELATAYRDFGLRDEAFDFTDGLRRRDPEFGGDRARKRRLLDLLREVM